MYQETGSDVGKSLLVAGLLDIGRALLTGRILSALAQAPVLIIAPPGLGKSVALYKVASVGASLILSHVGTHVLGLPRSF